MKITVYLGASEGNDPALKTAVQELGRWIGQSGNALVYGGSRSGLTKALLELPQPPTCIIFPDDFSALGGYNAISEKGLSIPEDVSVMGYDGIYLSRVVKPQLVTYQQNTAALGRTAADKLIELIEHPRVTLPEQIRVSGKLLDGGSVSIL